MKEIRAEYNFEDVAGKSPALRQVLGQIEIVARTGSTVSLRGETAMGKELVARVIHSHSPQRDCFLMDSSRWEGGKNKLDIFTVL